MVFGNCRGLNRHLSAHDQWIAFGCLVQHQRIEETPMKTNVYFGLAITALAITLQASSATARGGGAGGGFGQPHRGPYFLGTEAGFGSRTPVTLPPDRHSLPGESTGIPVTKTPSSELVNAQPKHFRPR
jgi:hypothetical protein